jgi:hypothetical protein
MEPREPSKKPLPNLTKIRDLDRQQHVQAGLDAGLTREQAERHADEELRERVDASD